MQESLDSPFPGGPDGDNEQRCRELLGTLESADIELTLGGKRFKSANALREGDHLRVLTALRHRDGLSADEYNELGCAEAWERNWADAKRALTDSKQADGSNESEKERAKKNMDIVTEAEALSG